MFIECMDFYETDKSFLSKSLNINEKDLSRGKLVVKAHEKEIYCLSDDLILAKIHRDNNGEYPFSKVDFLSHKLQEIVFPQFVPKIHFALFDNEAMPMFVMERVKLDNLHKAYNIQRQSFHKLSGRDFYYDPNFLRLDENDDIEELAKEHFEKVNIMQRKYSYLIDRFGIAFDHSHVNITWKENDTPISVEVHKCRRDYLFNLNKCKEYFENQNNDNEMRKDALIILNRIEQLL